MSLDFEKKQAKNLLKSVTDSVDIYAKVEDYEHNEYELLFDIESLKDVCKNNEVVYKQYERLIKSFFVYTGTVFKYEYIVS